MKIVTASEANRQFSKLLREVQDGEIVTITSHGKVVARLSAADEQDEREKRREAMKKLLQHLQSKPEPEMRMLGKFNRDWAYDD